MKPIIRQGYAHLGKKLNLHTPLPAGSTVQNFNFLTKLVPKLSHFILFHLTAFCGRGNGLIPPICKTNIPREPRNLRIKFHQDICNFSSNRGTGGRTDKHPELKSYISISFSFRCYKQPLREQNYSFILCATQCESIKVLEIYYSTKTWIYYKQIWYLINLYSRTYLRPKILPIYLAYRYGWIDIWIDFTNFHHQAVVYRKYVHFTGSFSKTDWCLW